MRTFTTTIYNIHYTIYNTQYNIQYNTIQYNTVHNTVYNIPQQYTVISKFADIKVKNASGERKK
jgi:hypothetical protein